MANLTFHDSMGTPNYPAIAYAPISGVTAPANQFPDTADVTNIIVPLHVRSFDLPQSKSQVNVVDVMPIINPHTGQSFGGKRVFHGSKDLPKLTMEGFIDTPCTVSGTFDIPQVIIGGSNMTYADLISHINSGQLSITSDGEWVRSDPLWFRDPYGRVYNKPRIYDFSGTYVEQVPGRTNFNMVMMV